MQQFKPARIRPDWRLQRAKGGFADPERAGGSEPSQGSDSIGGQATKGAR
jgi:hypothetical protein